jgi:crossover junction endodeoxyribonuclease RuvC
MPTLGIDPGLCDAGIGVINGDHYIASEQFHVGDSKQPMGKRLKRLTGKLTDMALSHKVGAIVMESGYAARMHNGEPISGKTAVLIGLSRGAIYLRAAELEIPVIEVTPSAAKKAATGRGNASKEQVRSMIKAAYRLDKCGEDEADALAIAQAGQAELKLQRLTGVV